ncbi:hypothetical protein FACS1894186_6810 [Alphaproteobacteria bacterium]|nr:hypothetical protein FACS1894186_6810 [Alphaproteobacteria bacterium]
MAMTTDEVRAEVKRELALVPVPESRIAAITKKLLPKCMYYCGKSRPGSAAPFDFRGRLDGAVARFAALGLTREDYLAAAMRCPTLFTYSPDAVYRNIAGVAARFSAHGLTIAGYLRAALKSPTLFCQKPETVAANITGTADLCAGIGLTVDAYLRAALKAPALFGLAPSTVLNNISAVAAEFAGDGLTMADYLRAALKQPTLLCMAPETVASHIRFIQKMLDGGLFRFDSGAVGAMQEIMKAPMVITLSNRNLRLHEWLAMKHLATRRDSVGYGLMRRKSEILAEYSRCFPNNRRARV